MDGEFTIHSINSCFAAMRSPTNAPVLCKAFSFARAGTAPGRGSSVCIVPNGHRCTLQAASVRGPHTLRFAGLVRYHSSTGAAIVRICLSYTTA